MDRQGLAFLIGRRYLFSKKSHNAINIITGISVVGVAVVTAAMVIVLSVFNGFEGLVVSLYSSFDPPVLITPSRGKVFLLDDEVRQRIATVNGVNDVVEVLEENCLVRYRDRQHFATVKGVSDGFITLAGMDSLMTDGVATLQHDSLPQALLGQGVAYFISANMHDPFYPIELYVPRRGAGSSTDPSRAFSTRSVYPAGVFSVQHDVDVRYIVVPISLARDLLDRQGYVSALAISLADGAEADPVITILQTALGPDFVVRDRFKQHALLYSVMQSEKWAVFLILAFILMISIFNVTGSLTMLILEKKRDVAILRSMGADTRLVRRIFLTEGMQIVLIGAVAGIAIGLFVCWLQQNFGLVRLNTDGSYVVQAYPVLVKWSDVLNVCLTVVGIGAVASAVPVLGLVRNTVAVRLSAS
jgi:lipoprotein-releasing system permease protein